jgi:hypothetical protein
VVPFAAGTVVSKSHLSLARVLAGSFRERHPGIPFFVLLADEVDGFFEPSREPFELLGFGELGIANDERLRFRHAQQPLSYAAAPHFLRHLLDRGFARALFIKQESLVMGDLSGIAGRLARHPILLTPHLLDPLEGPERGLRELNILQVGACNAGLVGVAEHPVARRFLDWWSDRVHDHCRLAVAEGIHYEQRWIDLVPAFFEGTHLLRDPGCNVAHWNLPERRVAATDGKVTVDGQSATLFRFSGFDPEEPERLTRHTDRLDAARAGPAGEIFRRYGRLLLAAGWSQTRRWPYAYGAFDNAVPIPDVARQIYRELGSAADPFGDPFSSRSPDSFFHWLNAPEEHAAGGAGVSRLWSAVYRQRPDVQQAFPDYLGEDRPGFLRWAAASGAAEYGIPGPLMADPGAPRE